jgi:hypothetical protein
MQFATYLSSHISLTSMLSILVGILFIYVILLHYKVHKFTRGQTGASLEGSITACIASVAEIEKRNELISKHALMLEEKVSHTLRNAKTLRYKAFDMSGSNQSFSVALVNERGSGVILSSLHTHDRMSTFAKPIEKYTSTYELTEEEEHVLQEARSSHKGQENED